MSSSLPALPRVRLQAYCDRLAISLSGTTDEDILQQLHQAHPLAIPFENLNSFSGLPIQLLPDAVFDKLVSQGRGGYCFEQNQLFMRVLQSLGFTVKGLSARVLWMLPSDVSLPRTHMALLVTLNGKRYLADVGFGGLTMTGALDLDSTDIQHTPHEDFRLRPEQGGYILSVALGKQWQDMYWFSLDPMQPQDYETANWYVSTHPQSRFVNELICARPDRDSRHALNNRRYIHYLPGNVPQARELQTPEELKTLLHATFRIDLNTLPELDTRLHRLFKDRNPA